MDKILERNNLLKLIQEEINNLIRPISIKEAESTINNFPKQKAPLVDSIKKFKRIYQLFQKIESAGILPNCLWIQHYLKPKSDKDIKRKKLCTNTSHEHRCKNSQKIVFKSNSTVLKKLYITSKLDLFQVCKTDLVLKSQLI